MHYKRTSMIIFGFIGLLIVSLSIYFGFKYLVTHNQWIGLIIGVLLMIIGILIYQLGEKNQIFYQLTFLINMIAIGFSITAYYVFKAYSLTFRDFFVAIIVSIGLLILFSLISRISLIKRHHKIFLAIFIFISFILSLSLWLSSNIFTGLSFYFLNIIYFFVIGIVSSPESFKDISKEMAWISFGAFILVSIIVLIILSEGEALSGIDGFSISGESKKNQKKSKLSNNI
jgi:hypothetical protein